MESYFEASPSAETHLLSPTEQIVATLWTEVLQTAEVPRLNDNFFALGGDSMAMVMLEFRIQEELSVKIPAGATLGAPSLRELSNLIDAHRSPNSRSEARQSETTERSGE